MTWRERRVADMASLINGFPFDSDDFNDSGDVPLVRIRDILGGDLGTFVPADVVPDIAYIYDGDVVIGMDGDFNVALWSRGPAALNQRLCVLRDNGNADARFLAYALPAHLRMINELTYSTTVKHLSSGQVRAIRMAAPDVPEQGVIADYLDRETGHIDSLIAKQEALIETLRERGAGVAEQALGNRVGIGNRLKWSLTEVDLRAGDAWEALPLMSVSINWGVRRRDEVSSDEAKAEDLSSYKLARRGDLVVNRMRAFQGALGVSPSDGIVSPDYAVLHPAGRIDAHWLAATMRTRRFVGEMTSRLKGIGGTEGGAVRTPRINVTDLLNIEVDLPPLEDQRHAIQDLTVETSKIDTVVAKAEQFITLAKERRAALISAAVTGQLNVSEAA